MTIRLEKIFAEIEKTEVFADIGCDHGYITKKMLDSKKCERAVITDISEKCLSKAKTVLKDYIEAGKVQSFVCDGFKADFSCDTALIAGMGGEEIIKILKNCKNLPANLILQPMKNTEKVRETAVKSGYKIKKDFIFYDGEKYYNLLVLTVGEDFLTPEEKEFGRTNIMERGEDFIKYVKSEIEKIDGILKTKNVKSFSALKKRRERLKKYV